MIHLKPLSSLEKCFLDEGIDAHPLCDRFVMYQNERLSFQVAILNDDLTLMRAPLATVRPVGELAKYATVRQVVSVPSVLPTLPANCDDNYLRREPGLYPDVLQPLQYRGQIPLNIGRLTTLWIDVELDGEVSAGEYELTVALDYRHKKVDYTEQTAVTIRVLNATLPKQRLIHTEWFYTDCLAEYYNTRAFSERHWRIIERFAEAAAKNGINMILTPIFTPELDTYIGGERMTTQLVGIKREGDAYHFDFAMLDRWVDMCQSKGIEYFEFPHFFSQWGSKHTPKIVVEVDGKKKKLFGWHTDALSDEYRAFIDTFLPALLAYLKQKGIDQKSYFHVSDEPSEKHLEQYKACREMLAKHLSGYPMIDALSHVEFYDSGVVSKPIPHIRDIKPFLERNIDGLWAYYCSWNGNGCNSSDRLMSMPLSRTRILGIQLYLYRIEGFLNWGYNYYNNCNSYDRVNPFMDTTGGLFGTSGDAFIVYPGLQDEPWESIRLNALREAVDDMRALELCESVHGREFTEALIREVAGMEITFFDYPREAEFFLKLRERLASVL